jgi:YegS/Rv2252/BmrU family lipid kinase
MMHKIIVNPISGRGAGQRALQEITPMLRRYDLDCEISSTERPMHALDLARSAVREGCEVVVAVGGDGTANEVLNGLMLAKDEGMGESAFGVISVGQGNDFAFGVGVPPGLEAGCKVLAQGHSRTIDVGRVSGGLYPDGRYFGNGVGIGFDAVVGFEALKLKRLHGFLAYLVAALKTIFLYYRAPFVEIDYDGQILKQLALMVSIMNGRRMGGGFMMAPKADTQDGLFDLCIARQVGRARILSLIPHFLKGTQASQDPILTGQAHRLTVTALEGVLPAHADGETLCIDGVKLNLELLPSQIKMISPPLENRI